MAQLRAGGAEVVMTPPVGTALDGYGGRVGGAIGVHDDLHARALVVDDGTARAAILACDLVGVDRRLVAAVRGRVEAATDIPAANIMVAATHTHAGPAGLRRDLDAPLTEMMSRLLAGAIIAAHGSLRPAVLKAGRGSVDSVSQNRRHPDGPADDALRVLLFDSPDPRDGVVASVTNFACHPTVMFGTNMLISADYPAYVRRTIQQSLGDAPALFLNGACGDVNPAWMEQRFEEVERVGTIVGAEALRRIQELRPLGHEHRAWNIRWDELTHRPVTSGVLVAPGVRVRSVVVPLRLRRLPPPQSYDQRLRRLQIDLEALAPDDTQARRALMAQITRYRTERGVAERLHDDGRDHYVQAEVQAIALGAGCVVLGLPGECFAETGAAIQSAAGIPHLLIACYANHYAGYIVPEAAWDGGGYEPGVAMVDETAEEALREGALRLLAEVTAAG